MTITARPIVALSLVAFGCTTVAASRFSILVWRSFSSSVVLPERPLPMACCARRAPQSSTAQSCLPAKQFRPLSRLENSHSSRHRHGMSDVLRGAGAAAAGGYARQPAADREILNESGRFLPSLRTARGLQIRADTAELIGACHRPLIGWALWQVTNPCKHYVVAFY
jgi:hypothetical protein